MTGKPQGRWGSSRPRIGQARKGLPFFMENVMANWSKRTSRKSGTNTRTTRTTNSKGGSTISTSGRVGTGPRVTESIKQQNGKVVHRRYTTEYHPTLGTKRTTKTVYASSNAKPKKPRKTKSTSYKRRRRSNTYHSGGGDDGGVTLGCLGLIFLGFLILGAIF